MSKYIQEFLSLKCAGDVLNAVSPIGNKAEKEISEAMAIIKRLRDFILSSSAYYNIVDLCSGNALVPVLSAHLFNISRAIAVDKKPRTRKWLKVRGFDYINEDIYNPNYLYEYVNENTILTAVHPCQDLAKQVISIYQKSKACGLILMPCCEGPIIQKLSVPSIIKEKISRYELWTWELADMVNGHISVDKHCMSPKNLIIVARK